MEDQDEKYKVMLEQASMKLSAENVKLRAEVAAYEECIPKLCEEYLLQIETLKNEAKVHAERRGASIEHKEEWIKRAEVAERLNGELVKTLEYIKDSARDDTRTKSEIYGIASAALAINEHALKGVVPVTQCVHEWYAIDELTLKCWRCPATKERIH